MATLHYLDNLHLLRLAARLDYTYSRDYASLIVATRAERAYRFDSGLRTIKINGLDF